MLRAACFAVLLCSLTLAAEAQQAKPAATADARASIARKIPGARPEDIRPSPVAGVFEVVQGADMLYVTADGKYVFAGDLYDLGTDQNLTEQRRRDLRVKLLASVPESQMLVFSPAQPKYTVTVFTDIDCGYCRKLHSEMDKYNAMGIRVRYLFFPREGPNSESWDKSVAVWCASNRNDALTRAKRGETIRAQKCATPVAKDFDLGRDLGLRGTPAIFLPNGDMLPGYLPPAALAARLQGSAVAR